MFIKCVCAGKSGKNVERQKKIEENKTQWQEMSSEAM